mgnify:CR=1 FL=1|jgi:hypothetical protein
MSLNKDELVVGGIYQVDARNYFAAIWDGEKFLGPSRIDGNWELVPEWHYSDGYPRGTVTSARKIGPLNITINTYGGNFIALLAALSEISFEDY